MPPSFIAAAIRLGMEADGQKIVCEGVQPPPDATLDERCQLYAERCQVRPSRSSMQRTLALLKLTRTKRLITFPRVTAMMATPSAASIKRTSGRLRPKRAFFWMRQA
jgi:hypothetical protein